MATPSPFGDGRAGLTGETMDAPDTRLILVSLLLLASAGISLARKGLTERPCLMTVKLDESLRMKAS
jgi:hypothetical protein